MNAPLKVCEQIELLSSAVEAARRARFWRLRLPDTPIASLGDFARLPIVDAREYRCQRFADIISAPSEIDWIPGPWLGQSPERSPVAEGATEARLRVRIMREVLSRAVPDVTHDPVAVVASTFDNRYFGAEMCAVFIRMGISAHLATDSGVDSLADLLSVFEPDIVAPLTNRVDIGDLPRSVRCVITVGADSPPEHIPHIDLYVCNEFGVLGMREDSGGYHLAHSAFHFETSPNDTLIVTPYFSRVQPIIRLDTGDRTPATAPPNLC